MPQVSYGLLVHSLEEDLHLMDEVHAGKDISKCKMYKYINKSKTKIQIYVKVQKITRSFTQEF